MAQITMAVAAVLMMIGAYAWQASSGSSVTALIPALLGVLLLIAGVVALRASARPYALRAAAGLALIGVMGSLYRALPGALDKTTLGLATTVQLWMAGVLLLFLAILVRAFFTAQVLSAESPCEDNNNEPTDND